MEIWLNQNETKFRLAILPSEYELTSESNNTQIDIHALGEINLIGKRKLKNISISSFFPSQNYEFCQYTGFPSPEESVKIIEEIKNNGSLRLIITGTPINMDVTIESFVWGENEGTKDIHFSLECKEYRKVNVYVRQETKATNKIEPVATQRMVKPVKNTIYTVVKGDCLIGIAKKITGSTANWKAIYLQNKDTIGGNPNKIYPGQRLVITV